MKTDELRALLAAATPGEWIIRTHPRDPDRFHVQAPRIDPSHPYDIEVLGEDDTLYPTRRADAALIVAMRNELPALLDRLDAAERDAARLDALARFVAKNRGLVLHTGEHGGGPYCGVGFDCRQVPRSLRESLDACVVYHSDACIDQATASERGGCDGR